MVMRRYLLAAVVFALAFTAVAAAKGPVKASISGPGLERSLVIKGDGEGPDSSLGTLADASGFVAQVFRQSPDPTLASRPSGTLGVRYRAVYLVPGPSSTPSRLIQYIYPYAKPVALTYVKPGQKFWSSKKTHGGWYRASPALKRVLVRAGLPAKAPPLSN
jgi:hypothetical protein